MFLKIDKKVLITVIVILILLILIIVAVYGSMNKANAPQIENSIGGTNIEVSQEPVLENEEGVQSGIQVQAEGEAGGGTLFICEDKCGDGICQEEDPGCAQAGSCICAETAEDCPADCQ